MVVAGLLSILIASATIPLLYIIVGLVLNVGFSFLWLIDMTSLRKNKELGQKIFKYYTLGSIILVFCFSLMLLFLGVLHNAT